MHTVELSERLYLPLHNILSDLKFESEKDALVEYSLISAMHKRSEFEDECNRFARKYNVNFEEFEKRVTHAKEESFEEWDDYMAWKFAEKGRKHWNKRIDKLNDALRGS